MCKQAPPSPMVNTTNYIPTSQAPAPLTATHPPREIDRDASPTRDPVLLQRASPPPTIQQAAAATNQPPVRMLDDSHVSSHE